MGDFQFWLYVIIAIIYVLSRAFKKTAQQEQTPERRTDLPPSKSQKQRYETSESPKQLSFEELLREITEGKQPASGKSSRPTTVQEYEYVDYDDNLPDEEQDLEDVEYASKRDNLYEVSQSAKHTAFQKQSLEETLKLEDSDMTYGRFKEFEREPKHANALNAYLKELKDPDGFKKAFIMSEILNRKYT